MYKYMPEVNELINGMINTFQINVEKSLPFYNGRINNFFNEYMGNSSNENKPLDALTYFDIETYINSLKCKDSEKVNHYNALKRFFEYTYLKGSTKEIISQVKKPIYKRKENQILSDGEYHRLKEYIVCKDHEIKERLLLGLFLFTGLSRKYIANIVNNQFVFKDGVYKLCIWKDDKEIELPLKAELQLLINEYYMNLDENSKLNRLIEKGENSISGYVSKLIKKIIGRECTPTILSNTFIAKALSNGNNIYEVSRLTLESITTIEKHIKFDDDLENKQKAILNSF
ncbi:hypothetical protein DVW12_10010 [Clostridium botulinum]|nr:hypothetical protein [Clostridium botulinum]